LIETVAVLVVCGDIPHHLTEQVKSGQARVGVCGPELLLLVKFRRRLAQGGSLEEENRCVIALVVNEPQIGSGFQPAGTRTTHATAPSEGHRNRLPNDGGYCREGTAERLRREAASVMVAARQCDRLYQVSHGLPPWPLPSSWGKGSK